MGAIYLDIYEEKHVAIKLDEKRGDKCRGMIDLGSLSND